MVHSKWAPILAAMICLTATRSGSAQTAAPKPDPDILIFVNGEKLIGRLVSAKGSSVVFKSDMAGEITVDWSKIQELRSSQKFAAIPKGVNLRKLQDASQVPQGPIAMTDQKLQVSVESGTKTLPVADISNVVNETSFQNAFHHTPFTSGWKGGASFGLAVTEATQNSQSYSAALNMVRSVPGETWLDQRSRTILNFNEAYGKVSQTGVPTVKTSFYHFDLEQDWYLSPRLFAFGGAAFDHSFSQGLQLQQSYGGGLGYVLLKTANQELDAKVSANFIDQRFEASNLNKKLFGTVFSETYVHKFAHGVLLNEQGGVTPAWNDTKAYSAFASAGLTLPVYHRIGFTLGALDNFLNDPPPGFKKNSFQVTAGATYSFK